MRVMNQNVPDTSTYNFYLNYIYDPNADTSTNPFAGQAVTVFPTDGA